ARAWLQVPFDGSVLSGHPTEQAPLAFVGSPRRDRRAEDPFHPALLDLLGRRWRRDVVVELPRVGSGQVCFGDGAHDEPLRTAERPRDDQLVTGPDSAMRLDRLPVDDDLSVPAGFLRFRSSLEDARHVEPDVESNAVARLSRLQSAYYLEARCGSQTVSRHAVR